MHERACSCGENYIGKTGQNFTIRWDEQCDIGKIYGQEIKLVLMQQPVAIKFYDQ